MNTEETEDTARFILDIRADLGIPILLVEHDMGLVMDLADRVLAMEFGKPIACDVPSVIQRHPGVIASYLGHGHDDEDRTAAGDPGLAATGVRGMEEAR
jgi:branched-chain amino acid transport system ATP-binding protein